VMLVNVRRLGLVPSVPVVARVGQLGTSLPRPGRLAVAACGMGWNGPLSVPGACVTEMANAWQE
jgi:hypothetical protein